MSAYEDRIQRTQNFCHDRFGMFIHWGLYSIPAKGEWVLSHEQLPPAEYDKYFDLFDPIHYDPKKWAKLAKEAGMNYAVMSTKHHDGFCLFDSQYTDYKSTNTKAGRDLIREYVDAFRSEGLRVGFYYSLLDWHHPDYPHYGDAFHPMRANEAYKDADIHFENYVQYLHQQVRELLTNYGTIDIMWFDFSYQHMQGEAWEATKLVEMVRTLQPGIVIDNRLGGDALSDAPHVYSGDFLSPEQFIPPKCPTDAQGKDIPWEACITLNHSWGYTANDYEFKSPERIIKILVENVSKGGNTLINVGPSALGDIPKESIDILTKVGEWMHANSRSIYGCGKAEYEKPEWGRLTQKGKLLYAHIYDWCLIGYRLAGMEGKIKRAVILSTGAEAKVYRPWYFTENDVMIDLGSDILPDEVDTVVELELF